jgi:hAT family C-terminal dimerisation region
MCVDSVVKMRATLRRLAAEPGHDLHSIIPTDRQFDVLQELLHPLMMIKQSSERLSAERPALHMVMCCLMNIMTFSQSRDFREKSDAYQNFITCFENEMLKPNRLPDYGRTVIEFCIGNFLHPRFMGLLLRSKTSRDYVPIHEERTIEFIKDLFRTQIPETEAMEVDSPSFLNRAMDENEWEQIPSFVEQSESRYQAMPRDVLPIEKELDTWMKFTEKSNRTDLDILGYWKEKEQSLPLLAKVARRYYGIPVTSASSERLFSAAGNVITPTRTLLNTEKAEQLIFVHDNYWNVEPTIKKWQTRNRSSKKPTQSQESQESGRSQEEAVDDPQPGTSGTQSQSLLTPRSRTRRPLVLESETESDSD